MGRWGRARAKVRGREKKRGRREIRKVRRKESERVEFRVRALRFR